MVISLFAAGMLGLLTLILHGSALQGFWRFDDPMVLQYVVEYPRVMGYFFSPEQWQALGVPFFTPWLVLDYWLDFFLFGLNPSMFYAHHLFVVWLSAFLTFILLNRYVSAVWAGVAASLFLLSAPVAVVAQQIMARHYVTGLVFAIIAILFWVRAHEQNSRTSLVLASGFYLLAMLNKEIFAPLPLVLFFLMGQTLAYRFRAMIPLALAGMLFVAWRATMLGKIVGGYHNNLHGVSNISHSIAALPEVLFGGGLQTWVAGLSLLVALAGFLNSSRNNWLIATSALIALSLPFLAVAVSAHPIDLRFTFLPMWGICILLALGFSRLCRYQTIKGISFHEGKMHIFALIAALAIVGAIFQKGRESANAYNAIASGFDAQGRFMWRHDQTTGIVLHGDVAAGSLSFSHPLTMLKTRLLGNGAPIALPFAEAANKLPNNPLVYYYDPDCRCMKQVPVSVEGGGFQPHLPMTIRLARNHDFLEWIFDAPEGGGCFLVFEEINTSLQVPCSSGRVSFNLPHWVKGKFKFFVRTPSQQWNASPSLIFPEKGMVAEWKSPTA